MEIKLIYPPLRHIYTTQPFGVNYYDFYQKLGLKGHNGIDFRAFDGCPVVATHNGFVTWAGADGDGGISVQLLSNLEGEGFFTIYYHLKGVNVKVGDDIKAGKLIGWADNTGKYTTGDHLHFGLKRTLNGGTIDKDNGYNGAIDPAPFFLDKDWDKTPAYKRYGRKRTWQTFLLETKVMIGLRSFLKRTPTFEEINCCTYGYWEREVLTNPALAYNWKYLTKIEYQNGKQPFAI